MNIRDGEETLREAIDSVIAQSFDAWELIVWDDGSEDRSKDIVLSYCDPRIHYIRSDNHTNLARARNDAMGAAAGEWIAFLDQDDLWLPDKLTRQLALADTGTGLIYGRAIAFEENGVERDYDLRHEYSELPEGNIFHALFSESCFICMSSVMFKRSALAAACPIPIDIQTCPDYWLYLAVSAKSPAKVVQAPVCRYRLHQGNMSRSHAKRICEEMIWLLEYWTPQLGEELVLERTQVLQTLLAVEEMRHMHTVKDGLFRLARHGSLLYLSSRPFVWMFRAAKRRFETPRWRQLPSFCSGREKHEQ